MSRADQASGQLDYRDYRCPVTGAELELKDSRLQARAGGSSYEIHNGVPRFLRFEPAESPESKASLERLNEIAVREDWRKAIDQVFAESPGQISYNTDPGRLKRSTFSR